MKKKQETDDTINTKSCFYQLGKQYAYTLNPCDKYQYKGNGQRLKVFHNKLYEAFIDISKNDIDFEFYYELSEPKQIYHDSVGPRLHIHGLIIFNTNKAIFKWLNIYLHQLSKLGIQDIDICNDHKIWYKYCTKQQHIINHKPLTNYIIPDNPSDETFIILSNG